MKQRSKNIHTQNAQHTKVQKCSTSHDEDKHFVTYVHSRHTADQQENTHRGGRIHESAGVRKKIAHKPRSNHRSFVRDCHVTQIRCRIRIGLQHHTCTYGHANTGTHTHTHTYIHTCTCEKGDTKSATTDRHLEDEYDIKDAQGIDGAVHPCGENRFRRCCIAATHPDGTAGSGVRRHSEYRQKQCGSASFRAQNMQVHT